MRFDVTWRQREGGLLGVPDSQFHEAEGCSLMYELACVRESQRRRVPGHTMATGRKRSTGGDDGQVQEKHTHSWTYLMADGGVDE